MLDGRHPAEAQGNEFSTETAARWMSDGLHPAEAQTSRRGLRPAGCRMDFIPPRRRGTSFRRGLGRGGCRKDVVMLRRTLRWRTARTFAAFRRHLRPDQRSRSTSGRQLSYRVLIATRPTAPPAYYLLTERHYIFIDSRPGQLARRTPVRCDHVTSSTWRTLLARQTITYPLPEAQALALGVRGIRIPPPKN